MNEFVGKWRITHMDLWAQDMVDLIEPGHFDVVRWDCFFLLG